MKKSIAALLLGISVTANATSITVEGFGSDREAAKRDAFRTAIENVCGTVVLSDREHNNATTTKDQIITHSSCNVEKYVILEEAPGRIKIAVEVQPNNIAQRLQPAAKNKHFTNQPSLEAQVETAQIEKFTGEQLINAIFSDYPARAYNLTTSTEITSNVLTVYYNIAWNYNFIKSMIDALDSMKTQKSGSSSNMPLGKISIHYKKPKSLLYSYDEFYFNDLYKVDSIKGYFDDLFLLVQVTDIDGKLLINQCNFLYGNTGDIFQTNHSRQSDGSVDQLEIFGNVNKSGSIWYRPSFPMTKIYAVEASLVRRGSCKIIK